MIVFTDESLNVISFPIEDFTSMTWEESWTEPGAWSISLHPKEFDALKDAAYIYYDVCGWGVVESIEYTKDSFKLSGRELSAILDNYVITVERPYSARLEYIARTLVSENSNIGLGTNNMFAAVGNGTAERGSLLTALYNMLTPRGMSFKVSVDVDNHAFLFEVLSGVNKTSMQSYNKIAPVKRQSTDEYVVMGQTEAASARQGTRLRKGSYVFRLHCAVPVRLGSRKASTGTSSFMTNTYATDLYIPFDVEIEDAYAFWIYRPTADGGVTVDNLEWFELVQRDNAWAILTESKGNIYDAKYTKNIRDYKNYVVINVGDDENPQILEYDFRDVL